MSKKQPLRMKLGIGEVVGPSVGPTGKANFK